MSTHRIIRAILAPIIILSASCSQQDRQVELTPYPASVNVGHGHFKAAGAQAHLSGITGQAASEAIGEFISRISLISGQANEVISGNTGEGFNFIQDSSLAEEEYMISVSRKTADVRASSLRGFLYAIQTLKQLLPVEIYGDTPAPEKEWTIPCIEIKDAPRFGYRGMHLDVARHFFSTDEVKKIIDIMAAYKLNTLHWHLTDDQGWRVEIQKYPKLTEIGSIRKGTVIKKDWDRYDGIPYGGYYTRAQIQDVISYAASKGIEIIPEIDLPGHMLAALAAYPQFGCTGGPYEVWGRWGVADDVLCAGNEKTMLFLEDILSEIAELFPSEYVHIGGDECPKVRWEKCPVCQAKIKELGLSDDDKFNAEHYLQSYVMERMERFLAGKGKKIIGWDEILEGKPGPDATIMSWRGSDGGIKAANMGHDVIMTPNSHFYFDYYQAKDTDNEPFGIGGYIPIEKVYSYDPYAEITDDNARRHILGIQANVWTEYIKDNAHLEYMILPRLAALSEVQWTMPENKDWDRFLGNLSHEAAMYEKAGYNYAKTAFQVIGDISVNEEGGCVEVRLTTQGDAPIRYTLDGSEPQWNSELYTGPIEIRTGCTVKAAVERENMETRTYSQTFSDNKAMGKKSSLLSDPAARYRFNAPKSLVDGIRGGRGYSDGEWSGWYGTPLSVTLDMGGHIHYSQIRLGTLIDKPNDIFPPASITVSTSRDGVSYTEAGRIDIPVPGAADEDGITDYMVSFPETSDRFIRIDAQTIEALPAWHARAGKAGFLFADEIIVE